MSGRGAERILKAVEWLAAQQWPVGLSDLASALSLPKSSALDLLRILVGGGYVERMADGRYRLVRLPGEPTAETGRSTLLRLAAGPLAEAVRATGESGFIACLGEDFGVTYVAKLLPDREIRYDRDVTIPRRAHQVSAGIVLLGSLDPSALRQYAADERRAGRYDGTADALVERVEAAKASGHQVNLTGIVEGASGVSAAVRARDGSIIAAVNIAGPAERVGRMLDTVIPAVITCANAVTQAIGGTVREPADAGGPPATNNQWRKP